jgi:hypothetical protein
VLLTGWGLCSHREVNGLPVLILLVRIVGAYTVPVDTMVWLGTVVMVATMVLAFVVSGALGTGPMGHVIGAAVASADGSDSGADSRTVSVEVREVEENSSSAGSTRR